MPVRPQPVPFRGARVLSARAGTAPRPLAALCAAAALVAAVLAAAPAASAATAASAGTRTPPWSAARPLPSLLADTGGGTQLITATAPTLTATSGTLTWWERGSGGWRAVGSTPARFGVHGLTDGRTRRQGTGTTPTGLYALPFAFGTAPAPAGTALPYRPVTAGSWWCEDTRSAAYNRWVSPLPRDCRAGESERLAGYPVQYAHAVVVAFNYDRPVKGRGAGIFLHVNGSGATAGCVSAPSAAISAITAWLRPDAHPHIAIGTTGGDTAISHY